MRIIKHSEFTAADSAFNVLIPVDDKSVSEDALESIRSRPWHPATRFRLLTVLPSPFSQWPIPVSGNAALYALTPETDELNESSAALRSRAESFGRDMGGAYKVDSVTARGDARDTIIDHAYNWPANLIVMGSHAKTVLARFFLGSVSSAVTLTSPCSVEVVRPGKVSSQAQR